MRRRRNNRRNRKSRTRITESDIRGMIREELSQLNESRSDDLHQRLEIEFGDVSFIDFIDVAVVDKRADVYKLHVEFKRAQDQSVVDDVVQDMLDIVEPQVNIINNIQKFKRGFGFSAHIYF